MLKHEIRSAITAGNKVIHNIFSVDLCAWKAVQVLSFGHFQSTILDRFQDVSWC